MLDLTFGSVYDVIVVELNKFKVNHWKLYYEAVSERRRFESCQPLLSLFFL